MSEEDDPNGTVHYRPSPLQGARGRKIDPPAGDGRSNPTPPRVEAARWSPARRAIDDDIPAAPIAVESRNLLMTAAGPLLSLVSAVRSGRLKAELPDIAAEAERALEAFSREASRGGYPTVTIDRARYALCATVDDIVQNLPRLASQALRFARENMLVRHFDDKSGGDRFWILARDMLARPAQNQDLIELFHACLAAGFEGRHRKNPNGRRELDNWRADLYSALEHVKSLSSLVLSPNWQGSAAPRRKVGFWTLIATAGAAAGAFLIVLYAVFVLLLSQAGKPAMQALQPFMPSEKLRLAQSRPAPQPSSQKVTLEQFLKPQIDAHLVVVEEDGSTVRVRTQDGEMFASGSDKLVDERVPLIQAIAQAIVRQDVGRAQPLPVTVEGYTDTDPPSRKLYFRDNLSLSQARADYVAKLIGEVLKDPGRVSTKAFGEADPVATNTTPEGKSLNRRVEIALPRLS